MPCQEGSTAGRKSATFKLLHIDKSTSRQLIQQKSSRKHSKIFQNWTNAKHVFGGIGIIFHRTRIPTVYSTGSGGILLPDPWTYIIHPRGCYIVRSKCCWKAIVTGMKEHSTSIKAGSFGFWVSSGTAVDKSSAPQRGPRVWRNPAREAGCPIVNCKCKTSSSTSLLFRHFKTFQTSYEFWTISCLSMRRHKENSESLDKKQPKILRKMIVRKSHLEVPWQKILWTAARRATWPKALANLKWGHFNVSITLALIYCNIVLSFQTEGCNVEAINSE